MSSVFSVHASSALVRMCTRTRNSLRVVTSQCHTGINQKKDLYEFDYNSLTVATHIILGQYVKPWPGEPYRTVN